MQSRISPAVLCQNSSKGDEVFTSLNIIFVYKMRGKQTRGAGVKKHYHLGGST